MKKIINWLQQRPDATRLEIYTGIFIGVFIANAIMDWFK